MAIFLIILLIISYVQSQDICRQAKLQSVYANTTVLRLSNEKIPEESTYKWTISFERKKICKNIQRCNLMSKQSSESLRKYLQYYVVDNNDPTVLLNNSLILPGVDYNIELVVLNNGKNISTKTFKLPMNISDDVAINKNIGAVKLLGPNISYADLDYFLVANLTLCSYQIENVTLYWKLLDLSNNSTKNIIHSGTDLRIAANTLQSATNYAIQCDLIGPNDVLMDSKKQTVNILKRTLSLKLNTNALTTGIDQPIRIIAISEGDTTKDDIEWSCRFDGSDGCDGFQANSAILMLESGFKTTGKYNITAKITKDEQIIQDSCIVTIQNEISRSIEISNMANEAVNPSDVVEITGRVTKLVTGCLLEWCSLEGDPYIQLDLATMPGYTGVYNVTIKEDTILEELTDINNETVDKEFTLTIPAMNDTWAGLKGNASYLFRMTVDCPIEGSDEMSHMETDVIIKTNSGPKGKPFTVSPATGVALLTKFTFSSGKADDRSDDYPLSYQFGYTVENETVYFVALGDVFTFDTILPYSDTGPIPTKLRVCDNKRSCSDIKGPNIDVTLPNNLTEKDDDNLKRTFTTSLTRRDYNKAFTYAMAILQTFKGFKNDLLITDMEDFITCRVSEEYQSLIGADSDEVLKLYAQDLIKYTMQLAGFVKLPEGLLKDIITLREKLSSNKIEKIVTKEDYDTSQKANVTSMKEINQYLEITEFIIETSIDKRTISEQKDQLINKLSLYLGHMCVHLYSGKNVKIDLATIKLTMEKFTTRNFNAYMLVPTKGNTYNNHYIQLKMNELWKPSVHNSNLCLVKGVFKEYLNQNGFVYLADIFDATTGNYLQTNSEQSNMVKMKAEVANQQGCAVYYKNKWETCNVVEEKESILKCNCKFTGYYSYGERLMVPTEKPDTTLKPPTTLMDILTRSVTTKSPENEAKTTMKQADITTSTSKDVNPASESDKVTTDSNTPNITTNNNRNITSVGTTTIPNDSAVSSDDRSRTENAQFTTESSIQPVTTRTTNLVTINDDVDTSTNVIEPITTSRSTAATSTSSTTATKLSTNDGNVIEDTNIVPITASTGSTTSTFTTSTTTKNLVTDDGDVNNDIEVTKPILTTSASATNAQGASTSTSSKSTYGVMEGRVEVTTSNPEALIPDVANPTSNTPESKDLPTFGDTTSNPNIDQTTSTRIPTQNITAVNSNGNHSDTTTSSEDLKTIRDLPTLEVTTLNPNIPIDTISNDFETTTILPNLKITTLDPNIPFATLSEELSPTNKFPDLEATIPNLNIATAVPTSNDLLTTKRLPNLEVTTFNSNIPTAITSDDLQAITNLPDMEGITMNPNLSTPIPPDLETTKKIPTTSSPKVDPDPSNGNPTSSQSSNPDKEITLGNITTYQPVDEITHDPSQEVGSTYLNQTPTKSEEKSDKDTETSIRNTTPADMTSDSNSPGKTISKEVTTLPYENPLKSESNVPNQENQTVTTDSQLGNGDVATNSPNLEPATTKLGNNPTNTTSKRTVATTRPTDSIDSNVSLSSNNDVTTASSNNPTINKSTSSPNNSEDTTNQNLATTKTDTPNPNLGSKTTNDGNVDNNLGRTNSDIVTPNPDLESKTSKGENLSPTKNDDKVATTENNDINTDDSKLTNTNEAATNGVGLTSSNSVMTTLPTIINDAPVTDLQNSSNVTTLLVSQDGTTISSNGVQIGTSLAAEVTTSLSEGVGTTSNEENDMKPHLERPNFSKTTVDPRITTITPSATMDNNRLDTTKENKSDSTKDNNYGTTISENTTNQDLLATIDQVIPTISSDDSKTDKSNVNNTNVATTQNLPSEPTTDNPNKLTVAPVDTSPDNTNERTTKNPIIGKPGGIDGTIIKSGNSNNNHQNNPTPSQEDQAKTNDGKSVTSSPSDGGPNTNKPSEDNINETTPSLPQQEKPTGFVTKPSNQNPDGSNDINIITTTVTNVEPKTDSSVLPLTAPDDIPGASATSNILLTDAPPTTHNSPDATSGNSRGSSSNDPSRPTRASDEKSNSSSLNGSTESSTEIIFNTTGKGAPIKTGSLFAQSSMSQGDTISLVVIGLSIIGMVIVGVVGTIYSRIKRERTIETSDALEFPKYANVYHQDTLQSVPS